MGVESEVALLDYAFVGAVRAGNGKENLRCSDEYDPVACLWDAE